MCKDSDLPHIKYTAAPLQNSNQVMLFREIITVCCENKAKRMNALCGKTQFNYC